MALDTAGTTVVDLDDDIFDVVDFVALTPVQGSGTANQTYGISGPDEHFYMDDLLLLA